VTMAEIARCPIKSLSPAHYWDDGTCRCAQALRIFTPDHKLVIMGPSGPMVTIDTEDHTVEFGADYTPTGAARVFWESLVDPAVWHQLLLDAVADMERAGE
jgi:hypothetical protein